MARTKTISTYLSPATYRENVKKIPTRNGYGDGVVQAGKKNEDVIVLCCDLTDSTRSKQFKDAFPERFIQMGIAEQSMAGVAGGLALEGKVPFISSYAAFSPGRNWEQIRLVACLQNQNIKIMGAHAGVSVGPDGATHQMLEDIAIMRVLPNMTVLSPCDFLEAKRAVIDAAKLDGPVYIRFGRSATPSFTTAKTPFKIGRAEIFKDGSDVAIIGCGPLVHEALMAAKMLKEKGIDAMVINAHTIKPLDRKTIVAAAKKCGAVVTVEEAQCTGGLGGAVAECLAKDQPTPMQFVAVHDRFGTSGTPDELMHEFELDRKAIVAAALEVVKMK
ncbi:transketolase family protein [Candidatus Uhrbacteria bacterium]|nr:transketolase family protein [Candidatus Uhrbacteria bacterium]